MKLAHRKLVCALLGVFAAQRFQEKVDHILGLEVKGNRGFG